MDATGKVWVSPFVCAWAPGGGGGVRLGGGGGGRARVDVSLAGAGGSGRPIRSVSREDGWRRGGRVMRTVSFLGPFWSLMSQGKSSTRLREIFRLVTRYLARAEKVRLSADPFHPINRSKRRCSQIKNRDCSQPRPSAGSPPSSDRFSPCCRAGPCGNFRSPRSAFAALL